MSTSLIDEILRHPDVVHQPNGTGEANAWCPAHADKGGKPSLGINRNGKIKCWSCGFGDLRELARLWNIEINESTGGLTLTDYAAAKSLNLSLLRDRFQLSDITYDNRPAVRIPYPLPDGTEGPVRFRVSLTGMDRFRWRKDSKITVPYGMTAGNLAQARARGRIVVVEGESDVHTLWQHGIPAIGVPGAAMVPRVLNPWLAELEGVYLDFVIEPGQGGETFRDSIGHLTIRDRCSFFDLGDLDVNELNQRDPELFISRFEHARENRTEWSEHEALVNERLSAEAWEQAKDLASCSDILNEMSGAVEAAGLAGDTKPAQLLYLAVTARLFERPVNIAVKGVSSAGKSHLVKTTLRLFPDDAYHATSGLSERALAYFQEPMRHRILVMYELAGLHSEYGMYLLRSLLSENEIRYETTEKQPDGSIKTVTKHVPGPTGLITTTTRTVIETELETRLFSLTLSDSPDQVRAVMRSIAAEDRLPYDVRKWHALQTWLSVRPASVSVPYGTYLADSIPTVAVRLNRAFELLLQLIRACALIHQRSRDRTPAGKIVACGTDYRIVRSLVRDVLAEGIGASVPDTVRDTVRAVQEITDVKATGGQESPSASVLDVRKSLGIDRSAASRRIKAARENGFIKNMAPRGRAGAWITDEPLPEDVEVLPESVDCACSRCNNVEANPW